MDESIQQNQQPENKMGVMPINKLLVTMSLPMIISMFVQAMYNIIDSVFVSQIGENALAAVSLAFPIQMLTIAVSGGTGVGINALVSKALGEKKYEEANVVAKNGLFLALASYLVFALFGLFFSRIFFEMQTDDPVIVEYATQYLMVCLVFSFGIFFQVTLERLLQSTGKTFYNMITQGTGAILNIILDPILIFGWFGFPELGVMGAAVATVIGQIIAMMMSFFFNWKKNTELNIRMKKFRPNARAIKNIYIIGVPSIIMQAIGSAMTLGMNKICLMFSSTAVSVFGVYFKLQSFIFMPVFGLNNGMIPIIAYNYGAGNKQRITKTIRLSIIIAVAIMLVGFVIFQIFPAQLLGLFNASENMISIGVPALRSISLSFIFAGYCIIVGSVFQAMGNAMYTLWISIARQLVIILPAAYLFARYIGLNAIWFSFPLSELISVVMSTIFFRKIYKDKIAPLGEEPESDTVTAATES